MNRPEGNMESEARLPDWKIQMGDFDALHKKNWKHPNYDREMRLKIISAKLVQEVTAGSRKATVVEDSLIQSAALLILTTFQMEQDFLIQDGSTPDSKYLSTVNCLRATLDKLKVFPAAPPRKGNGDDPLASIINQ